VAVYNMHCRLYIRVRICPTLFPSILFFRSNALRMQQVSETAVVAEPASRTAMQPVATVPQATVKTEKEVMVELATDALKVSSEKHLRQRVAGDKQKLDLLDALQERKKVNSKISPVAGRLLNLVHIKDHPFYERRRVVFLLLTKYDRNWWHSSDAAKIARGNDKPIRKCAHAQQANTTRTCPSATHP